MRSVYLRRLGLLLLSVWGALTVIFVILRVAPGDQATIQLGDNATPDQLAALRATLGLDRPVVVQYLDYLAGAVRGDFGESYRFQRPALDVVLERLPATLLLTLVAATIAITLGVVLGTLAGTRPGGVVDRVVSGAMLVLQAIPSFWSGIMLILLLALTLRLLPTGGSGTPAQLVLPAVTLAIPFTAVVARITRSSVATTMEEPWIQTARSKGLTEPSVLARHVLRNSLIPVTTIIALQLGALMGGAVIVEQVFAWQGVGALLVDAVGNRDYAIVQAATVLIAVFVVLLNLLADVLAARLDPRITLLGSRA